LTYKRTYGPSLEARGQFCAFETLSKMADLKKKYCSNEKMPIFFLPYSTCKVVFHSSFFLHFFARSLTSIASK
jgi:hypothetical protein